MAKKSILGVTKPTHWMDEFNIGSVMHMKPLQMEDLEKAKPLEEYIFKDNLYQLVIYCSLSHFTMATELRFLEGLKGSKEEE